MTAARTQQAPSPPSELPPLAPTAGRLDVAGCEIAWYAGGAGDSIVVLVHGGGAHAGWWEPVLPELFRRHRVVAVDLSGHGDSGRRDAYSDAIWVDEVEAVIDRLAGGHAALVGHSLGGRLATRLAGIRPDKVSALVTLDAVIPPHGREPIPSPQAPKLYPSEAAIFGAFRLMPPQPPASPAVMERLARRSIRQRPDGTFTWKFDPNIFGNMGDRFDVNLAIPHIGCPVTVVQGGLSELTSEEMAAEYEELLGRPLELVVIPGSRHHTPLDASDAIVELLAEIPQAQARG